MLSFLFLIPTYASIREEGEVKNVPAHTVVCVLEAAEGYEEALKASLLKVATESRKEETNLAYRVHQSTENPAQFILYETWKSAAEHKLQFTKPYILAFIKESEPLLGKPYQGFFATELPF